MTAILETPADKAVAAPFVYGEMLLGDALIHQKVARRPAMRAALVAALSEVIL